MPTNQAPLGSELRAMTSLRDKDKKFLYYSKLYNSIIPVLALEI